MDSEELTAVDFLIEVLRQHEKTLDTQIGRLETLVERLENQVKKE